jgi:hypothetical protein
VATITGGDLADDHEHVIRPPEPFAAAQGSRANGSISGN